MPALLDAQCRRLFETAHPQCILISCLADGADLIAAGAWPENRRLETILPVPVDQWRRITSNVTDLVALDHALARSTPLVISESHNPDYAALADRLIENCDRHLAICNERYDFVLS